MGESENLHCEHDIRNEHVRYSTNLSTKTPRGRISKNKNRTNLFFEYRKTNIKVTSFFFLNIEKRKTNIKLTYFLNIEKRKTNIKLTYFFEYRKTKNEYHTNFFF